VPVEYRRRMSSALDKEDAVNLRAVHTRPVL
jgi:hypothetical protein